MAEHQAEGERAAAHATALMLQLYGRALAAGRAVGLYAATAHELPTLGLYRALRRRQVRCAFVRQCGPAALDFAEADPALLQRRGHGFAEPPAEAKALRPTELFALLLPGLAFDAFGTRLGYGAGLYDRFCATLPADTARVGLCSQVCYVEALPRQAHDVAMHWVVTPTGALACRALSS